MKRRVKFQMLAAILGIAIMSCTSCKKKNGGDDDGGGGGECAGVSVTIASMKKAASDAGYVVENDYTMWSSSTTVGGFMIVIKSRHIPVLEYKDKASADFVAQREQNGGYNNPIQNCKYLTFTGASGGVVKDEAEKTILENLINGRKL